MVLIGICVHPCFELIPFINRNRGAEFTLAHFISLSLGFCCYIYYIRYRRICRFLHKPSIRGLELTLSAERCTLKLYLIVAYVSTIGKGYAILDPRLTEHVLSYQTFRILALIIFVGLALSLEISRGALINYIAHFYDGTLYSVRGTETQARIAATLTRSAVNIAYSDEGSNVHVLYLDRIEHTGPREAEDVIVGVSGIMVAIGKIQVDGHVVHRRSLQVVPS